MLGVETQIEEEDERWKVDKKRTEKKVYKYSRVDEWREKRIEMSPNVPGVAVVMMSRAAAFIVLASN
jgi:hypothetical protein